MPYLLLKIPKLVLVATLVAAASCQTSLAEVRWGGSAFRQDTDWYASAEAREAADTLLLYQSPEGAWPKNTNLFKAASPDQLDRIHKGGEANTIDNGATTTPMLFLAKVIGATNETKYETSFYRGLDYLLEAQYPNGGWPQFYPLRKRGYYSHITFNDNAMMSVLSLLKDIAGGTSPYEFVDEERRMKADDAVTRGLDCILKLQIKSNGKPTAWCAQYDPKSLEPAWARSYEPPSLSGSESVGIVRYLMSIDEPSPEVVSSIEGAVEWFRAVPIENVRLERFTRDDGKRDRRLIEDANSPPLWARFYELETNRPLFLNRDSVFHYEYAAVDYERRNGYGYVGDWPASLLSRHYPAWQAKHGLGGN